MAHDHPTSTPAVNETQFERSRSAPIKALGTCERELTHRPVRVRPSAPQSSAALPEELICSFMHEATSLQSQYQSRMRCKARTVTSTSFYRSLRAVKVLLAALRSTLTVLAPHGAGLYRFALEATALLLIINCPCGPHRTRIQGLRRRWRPQ